MLTETQAGRILRIFDSQPDDIVSALIADNINSSDLLILHKRVFDACYQLIMAVTHIGERADTLSSPGDLPPDTRSLEFLVNSYPKQSFFCSKYSTTVEQANKKHIDVQRAVNKLDKFIRTIATVSVTLAKAETSKTHVAQRATAFGAYLAGTHPAIESPTTPTAGF